MLTPLFYEDQSFSNLYTPPFLLSPTPSPLFFLLFCFFGWISDYTTFVVLFYLMDLRVSSLGTLVPEGSWFVFYATRFQVYWGLTHNVDFYWYSDLIWQTHKHRQHTRGQGDWNTHINIYLHHLLRAQSSYLYYIKWLPLFRKGGGEQVSSFTPRTSTNVGISQQNFLTFSFNHFPTLV